LTKRAALIQELEALRWTGRKGFGTRGLERVSLHADLAILARLLQTLARTRAVPLAA
jgi:hypothetical protein